MKASSIKKGQIYSVKFPLNLRIHFIKVVKVSKKDVFYSYNDKSQDVIDLFSFVNNCEMGYFQLVR